MGEVASGKDDTSLCGRFHQGRKENSNPFVVGPLRDTERHEGKASFTAHCGYVTDTAAHSNSADVCGGVGCTAEMDVFEEQIRGEEEVFAGALWAVDRAVVANPKDNFGAWGDHRFLLQPVRDLAFRAQAESLPINITG